MSENLKSDKASEIPRRVQMQRWCEAERAIYDACLSVERMPADSRLTHAVILLGEARNAVADYIDASVEPPKETP